jgi:Tol biopolymer transport system component
VKANTINLWRVKRRADGSWKDPQLLLDPSKNKEKEPTVGLNEYGPAVDGSGKLYFYSFRQPYRGGARYSSSPEAHTQTEVDTKIPDPSAPTFVSYLYVSPDGKTAVMEGRSPGRRDTDLFYSCKQPDGVWTAPEVLPMVNSKASDGGPFITSDGLYLLFSSNRRANLSTVDHANLYVIKTTQLPIPCN